jgi:hypothetical protein
VAEDAWIGVALFVVAGAWIVKVFLFNRRGRRLW